ncbi:MAG: OmpH family outer membrane protein [Polyangiaceae bacterium]
MQSRARATQSAGILPKLGRLSAIAALAALVTVSGPAHAEGSLAVVDVQAAMMQTEEGMAAQTTLKKLADRRQQEIDGKQTMLTKMRDDIQKQARVLSREALARRMDYWQREMLSLQSSFVDYNKELEKKQNELTGPILQRMIAIITKIARQEGYDMVIARGAALYARPDLDITDRVVQMYNAGD